MLNGFLYRDDLDYTLVRMISVVPTISGLLLMYLRDFRKTDINNTSPQFSCHNNIELVLKKKKKSEWKLQGTHKFISVISLS